MTDTNSADVPERIWISKRQPVTPLDYLDEEPAWPTFNPDKFAGYIRVDIHAKALAKIEEMEKWEVIEAAEYNKVVAERDAAVAEYNEALEVIGTYQQAEKLREARVAELEAERDALRATLYDLLNDCINFDGGKLTDSIMERASNVLKSHDPI